MVSIGADQTTLLFGLQTFMCEVSKMPATSLFTPSMEHLAEIVPAIQGELSRAEQFVQGLTESDSASRISEWLEDDSVECFFEVGMDKCLALKVSPRHDC